MMVVLCVNVRIHQLFKAKLGLLGEKEDDGHLVAVLLKVSDALW